MAWWAVSVDAESPIMPPRFLNSDDADVRSVHLSRGRLVGLRCSVRATDGEAAVSRALSFCESRAGRPLGRIVDTRACIEGDLLGDDGPGSADMREPRQPLPRSPADGTFAASRTSTKD